MATVVIMDTSTTAPTFWRRYGVIATVWLAITFLWVVVIFVTDVPAWPITIWIAITIVPISALGKAQRKPTETP